MRNQYAIQQVLLNVNLNEGYSMSKYWLGFFARNGKFSIDILEKAILILYENLIANNNGEILAVSSLRKFKNNPIGYDDVTNHFFSNIEKKLDSLGFPYAIPHVRSSNSYEDADDTEKQFIGFDLDLELLRLFSLSVMGNSSIYGHFFFILNKLNLIVYPHEETGFGFINLMRNNHNSSITKFKQQFSDFPEFTLYLGD